MADSVFTPVKLVNRYLQEDDKVDVKNINKFSPRKRVEKDKMKLLKG